MIRLSYIVQPEKNALSLLFITPETDNASCHAKARPARPNGTPSSPLTAYTCLLTSSPSLHIPIKLKPGQKFIRSLSKGEHSIAQQRVLDHKHGWPRLAKTQCALERS